MTPKADRQRAPFEVRAAAPEHRDAWARLRCELWPEEPQAELRDEARQYFEGGLANLPQVLVAVGEGAVVGFAELNIRPYAEGCSTSRVAYLEAWYVREPLRRRGIGRALLEHAEAWARSLGCSEFASDALADNIDSACAHRAAGFAEVEVIRCFRKVL